MWVVSFPTLFTIWFKYFIFPLALAVYFSSSPILHFWISSASIVMFVFVLYFEPYLVVYFPWFCWVSIFVSIIPHFGLLLGGSVYLWWFFAGILGDLVVVEKALVGAFIFVGYTFIPFLFMSGILWVSLLMGVVVSDPTIFSFVCVWA